MTEKVPSLRRRLLVAITIPVLISGLLISLMSFLFSWHEIAEVYDAQMAHTAHVLIDLVEDDIKSGNAHLREDRNDSLEMQHRYERKTGYRLWHKDVLILESLRARDFGNFRAPEGFSNQELSGKPWRFFVHHDPERDITVEISQRYAIRYELINQLMLSLLIPAFIFLPVILTLIWLAAGKSLQPLMRLSADVDKRHSDDLTPIPTDTVPAVDARVSLTWWSFEHRNADWAVAGCQWQDQQVSVIFPAGGKCLAVQHPRFTASQHIRAQATANRGACFIIWPKTAVAEGQLV